MFFLSFHLTTAAGKRPPPRLQATKADIYIGRNSPFEAQLKRAQKMLDGGQANIILHGLGAAINRCINLALRLQQIYANAIEVHPSAV